MTMTKIPPAAIAYSCEAFVESIVGRDGSLLRCCTHRSRGRSLIDSIVDEGL